MKKPIAFLLACFLLVAVTACKSNGSDAASGTDASAQTTAAQTTAATAAPVSAVQGNTNGNIVNGGYIAIQDDRIYYNNGSDGGKLYAVNTDGSDKQKLNDESSYQINVAGNQIYYSIGSLGMYVINTDGTGERKLSDDFSGAIAVVGDRLYYVNLSAGGSVYVMNTDGSGRQRLSDTTGSGAEINISNDRIYYRISGQLYSINTDGSSKQLLTNDGVGRFCVVGDRIYYSNASDGYKLYVIHIDGTGAQKLSDDVPFSLNVAGGRIYYGNTGDSNKLYVMNTDGSGVQKLSDDSVMDINVAGDRVYYDLQVINSDSVGSPSSQWYSVNPDGSDRQPVN
ncbi:MAG: DUF5050 domain-containing protein [Oscillospiraceae bacterium]|nr:DUF5050 domain-containing protein [Oscillospiraceae bacterium]